MSNETGTPSSERLTGVLPRTAEEAVELWDKGEPLAAFEVESEGAHQQEIYAHAIELLRRGRIVDRAPVFPIIAPPADFTKREKDTAQSIAYVALLKGWAAMVAQHLAGGHIRAIVVRKHATA